jgi:phenylalanyl-tRNA synthetase alpha chain
MCGGMELQQELKRIERSAVQKARRAKTNDAVAKLRAETVGKKGALGSMMRSLRELPQEDRPEAGQSINKVKTKIESALLDAVKRLDAARELAELEAGGCDVTLPGRWNYPGVAHPLAQVQEDILDALISLGFSVADGPLIEHDWYNFEALNMPPDHPARDMQDTFFVAENVVLRTHTSNVQIRTMKKRKPPVRIVSPGMVFRNDDVDPTHSPVFHQIEGLWIDEKATFADLKGVLKQLAITLFGPNAELRFRPSFFPFTEPSAEVDVMFRSEKRNGWLEILGAGMVDPAVLEAVGYDPDEVQGFAFGLGVERIAMLRWGIDDIRLFYENDLRFLDQFNGR